MTTLPVQRQPDRPRVVDLGAVRVGSAVPGILLDAAERAEKCGGDATAALIMAGEIGPEVPLPGEGDTLLRWSLLATLGANDLTVARAIEPHLDALAILAEAGQHATHPALTRGVYAADDGSTRLDALPVAGEPSTEFGPPVRLHGVKPWCSLADRLDGALITARRGEQRCLYAVDLRAAGVEVLPGRWISRGLANLTTGSVRFSDVPATPVGQPGWYLDRPGFWWGGIGVAAVWFGAATAVAEALWPRPTRKPDQVALMHVGECEIQLAAARELLVSSARLIDEASAANGPPVDFARVARTVRGHLARTALAILERAGRAGGPAPLTFDEDHARRVADLEVYVRQEHAERDAAALGRDVVGAARPAPLQMGLG